MQYHTASQNPPALKAIFPMVAIFDQYTVVAPGGLVTKGFERYKNFLDSLSGRENKANTPEAQTPKSNVAPVDGPEGETLLAEALKEHQTLDRSVEAIRDLVTLSTARDALPQSKVRTKTGIQLLPTL